MATTSFDSIWSLGSTRIQLSAEVSLYCQPLPGQVSSVLKFISGGTLEILAPGYGQSGIGFFNSTTLTAAGLSAVTGTGYIFSAAEVLNIGGPATFYLNARGATCVAHMIFGKGQGTS